MHLTALQHPSYQPIERHPSIGLGKTLDQARQDFADLSASLGSGDVPGARTSFNDLKKLLASAGSIGAANSVTNDFEALGKALASGDLPSARKDLTQLQKDVSAAGHSHSPGLPALPSGVSAVPGLGAIQTGLRLLA